MGKVFDAMNKSEAEGGGPESQPLPPPVQLPPADATGEVPQATPAGEVPFQPPPSQGRRAEAPASAAAQSDSHAATIAVAPPQPGAPFRPAGGDYFSDLLVAHNDRGGALAEEYRALRTSLLASCPNNAFCYCVTSSQDGEGKTVTAMNLGIVMTEGTDRRTVLVDCNLRNQRMSQILNNNGLPGLAEVLMGQATLDQVIQPTSYPNLSVIPSGLVEEERVSDLIETSRLDLVVSELRRRFAYTIIDAPALNTAADASIVGAVAGEALLVVRMCRTRRDSVDKAIRLLRAANVKIAGIVLTDRKFFIPNMLYRYL